MPPVVALAAAAAFAFGPQLAQAAPAPSPSVSTSPSSEPTPAADPSTSPSSPIKSAPKAAPKVAAVAPNGEPDLVLTEPADSGENTILPLGTGEDGDFEAILTNSGASTTAATLTITLPADLTVDEDFGVYRDDQYLDEDDDDGGVQLACTTVSPTKITCALGAVAHGANTLLDIPVQPTPSAKVGTVGTFSVSAFADRGTDANPDDNTVSASVRFVGVAHLKATLTAPTHRVVVGSALKVTAAVTNEGPQPAVDTIGFVVFLPPAHFSITGFTGHELALPTLPEGITVLSAGPAAMHASVASGDVAATPAAVTPAKLPIVLWNVGTIAAGHSVSAVVTVKATSVGTSALLLSAASAAGDPACDDDSDDSDAPPAGCEDLASLSLTAIPVPVVAPKAKPDSSGSKLANTGAPRMAPLVLGGLLAVLIGALVLALGTVRRPRPALGRHRIS